METEIRFLKWRADLCHLVNNIKFIPRSDNYGNTMIWNLINSTGFLPNTLMIRIILICFISLLEWLRRKSKDKKQHMGKLTISHFWSKEGTNFRLSGIKPLNNPTLIVFNVTRSNVLQITESWIVTSLIGNTADKQPETFKHGFAAFLKYIYKLWIKTTIIRLLPGIRFL